jgi:hypothetical protein
MIYPKAGLSPSCDIPKINFLRSDIPNFLKSSVEPVRCGNVDLNDVLQGIPTTWTFFPMRYLGLRPPSQ